MKGLAFSALLNETKIASQFAAALGESLMYIINRSA